MQLIQTQACPEFELNSALAGKTKHRAIFVQKSVRTIDRECKILLTLLSQQGKQKELAAPLKAYADGDPAWELRERCAAPSGEQKQALTSARNPARSTSKYLHVHRSFVYATRESGEP